MLILKIYNIVSKFNIKIIIISIIQKVINKLNLFLIVLIIYINLYLLYKYLIKLGITKEKHFIINIIALQQLYKHYKIIEIEQILSKNNLVNIITKAKLNFILINFIKKNIILIKMEGDIQHLEIVN